MLPHITNILCLGCYMVTEVNNPPPGSIWHLEGSGDLSEVSISKNHSKDLFVLCKLKLDYSFWERDSTL